MLSGEVAANRSTRKSCRTWATTAHRPDSIGQLLLRAVTHGIAAIGGRATRRCIQPDHLTPLRVGDRPSADADVCRFLAAIHVRSGRIPLPSRCHEDQKPDRLLAIRPLSCTYW